MKCEDFLPALETAGIIRRAQANFHAGRCPRCAAVRERFLQAKRRWSDSATLTAVHREAWHRAVNLAPLPAPSKVARVPRWALATAALILVIVSASILTRPPQLPDVKDVTQDQPPTEALELPFPPFDTLERALDQLAIELTNLGNQAALMDARHDVDHLLNTYKPLGPSEQSQAEAN